MLSLIKPACLRLFQFFLFDSDMQTTEINIPNFVPYRKDRLNGREGGGSCIYVHETIRARELESFIQLYTTLLYKF